MKYPIPRKAIDQNIIGLGKTGAGKSSAARSIAEPMLEEQLPLCIIDPKGDWWGIKLSADGKRPGYPLVIFGGKHADVPINEHSGAHIAELFATGNRPCLIDLRGWMPRERGRLFVDFAQTLYTHNVGRKWVLIDEVHNFAPKGKVLDPQAGLTLHWANKLASEGRGLGINLIGLSQRPQKVHNDFLTSCETLIALRVLHKSDRDAYKDWIDGCGDPAKGAEMLRMIANLKRGTGFVWSPEIEFGPDLVAFPMFKTYDSFKPQEAGDAARLTGWADVNLDEVKAKLATVIEEIQANDPAELKKRIRELEKEIAAKPATGADDHALREAEGQGFTDGYTMAKKEGFGQARTEVCDRLNRLRGDIDAVMTTFQEQLRFERDSGTGFNAPAVPRQVEVVSPISKKEPKASVHVAAAPATEGSADRRMMIALAQNPDGLTQRKLGILADVKPGGSTWRRAMAWFRKESLINESGDVIKITGEGRRVLGKYEPLPTGEALRYYWQAKIGPGTCGDMFSQILSAGGGPIAAAKVAEAAGVEFRGSTWRRHMAHLRGLELVSGSDMLQASEELF